MDNPGSLCLTVTRDERVVLTDTTESPPRRLAIIEIPQEAAANRVSIRITAPKTTRIDRESRT